MAEYDAIAEQYKRSKQAVWRHYIEQYSLFQLTGDLTGKSVLDLACGEGHYTRLVHALGATRVAGVDISSGMIDLARAAEHTHPRGIEYVLGDARDVHFPQTFDVVIAAYLLNYARTEAELEQMARAIARNLKPAGRFISVNNNPAQSPAFFDATRKYGFTKSCPCQPENGSPITYTFYLDEGAFQVGELPSGHRRPRPRLRKRRLPRLRLGAHGALPRRAPGTGTLGCVFCRSARGDAPLPQGRGPHRRVVLALHRLDRKPVHPRPVVERNLQRPRLAAPSASPRRPAQVTRYRPTRLHPGQHQRPPPRRAVQPQVGLQPPIVVQKLVPARSTFRSPQ